MSGSRRAYPRELLYLNDKSGSHMDVDINVGEYICVKDEADAEMLEAFIEILVNLDENYRKSLNRGAFKALDDFHYITTIANHLVAARERGDLAMCLKHFTYNDRHVIIPQIADIFLRKCGLGMDVERTFAEIGISERIFGSKLSQQNRLGYERIYRVYISGLVMCTTNATTFADISDEVIIKWLGYYYNTETLTFKRPDLMPTLLEVHKKIFKELAKGIGAYRNNQNILSMGMTRRVDLVVGSHSIRGVLENPPAFLAQWVALWTSWRNTQPPRSETPTSAFGYLSQYLYHYEKLSSEPLKFLMSARKISLLEFYKNRRVEKGLRKLSGDDDFPLLRRFSKYVASSHLRLIDDSSYFPLVTEEDYQKFKNEKKKLGIGEKLAEADATPLPPHYYKLTREILEEGEHGWPGRHRLCRAVLEGEERYVPVLTALFLALFEIPVRTIQLRRLDSGEGDPRTFDGHRLEWIDNTGPLAGYWAREEGADHYRGYAGQTNSPGTVGFRINTNKHSSAYIIPWQNAQLHRLFYGLALWQRRWNRVTGPVQLEYDGEPEDGAKDRLPVVFPLFRMPGGRAGSKINPVSYTQVLRFWLDLMLEVQTRWNSTCLPEDRDYFVEMTKSGNQVLKSRYTPHGMRSAGITIMLQHGAPIEWVSKLFAGHKTVLESLYYAKLQAEIVSRSMDDVRASSEMWDRVDFFASLKNMDFDEAAAHTVNGSIDALKAAMANTGSWQRRDLGICPFNGMRCDDGSPDLRLVEGGRGNCLLCRHHVSGPEFGHAIWSYCNFLLFQIGRMNRRIIALVEETNEIENRLSICEVGSKEYRSLNDEIKRNNIKISGLHVDQVPLANTFAEGHRRLLQFEQMEKRLGDASEQILVVSDKHDLGWAETSEIEQAYMLQENAKIYKDMHDPEIAHIVKRFAETAMWNCGYKPVTMEPRSPEAIQAACDYTVKRVLREVSRHDLMRLEEGAVPFRELISADVADDIFGKGLALEAVAFPVRSAPMQIGA